MTLFYPLILHFAFVDMGITSRFNPRPEQAAVTLTSPVSRASNDEKYVAHETSRVASSDDGGEHLQGGIKEADAITKLWTWKHLVIAHILIWVINFMVSHIYPPTLTEVNVNTLTSTLSPAALYQP